VGWDETEHFSFHPVASHGTDAMGWDCPIPRGALVPYVMTNENQYIQQISCMKKS